jgi:hypothetical protein
MLKRMAQRQTHTRRDHARHRRQTATITWRAVLSACLLVLFGLQGIVAQGHSHVRNGAGASVITFGDVVIAKSDDASSGSVPRGDDFSNCGLCQSVSGAAAPLALAIVLLLPVPEAAAEPAYLRATVVDAGAVSFAWTARGPPQISPLHA